MAGKQYIISITATQPTYSQTDYHVFNFIETYATNKNIYTRGVDAQNDMTRATFGDLYASNDDGGSETRLRTGILRWHADGSYDGTNDGDPMLLSTLGTEHAGGVFNWGDTAPWYATLDAEGRIYASGNGSGQIFRVDSDTSIPKTIIRGLVAPRGLCAVGSGSSLVLYIADDTTVVRANLGTDDTLTTPLEVVATLGNYVRDVIIDDEGFLITAQRSGVAGDAPGYIERFDISGSLPVHRTDALLSIPYTTGQPVGLALNRGPNRSSASDDTLYYSMRGGTSSDNTTIGIHRLVNMGDPFGAAWGQVFDLVSITPPSIGGNISANADLTVDWAGNVILFENGNEEIIMMTPPSDNPAASRTTTGADTVTVSGSTSVGTRGVPVDFTLYQNYPNPFNPTTQIGFDLPASAVVTVTVYDILGNQVKELFNGQATAGHHEVVWDATNRANARVSSGTYLYRIETDKGLVATKRMLLLK